MFRTIPGSSSCIPTGNFGIKVADLTEKNTKFAVLSK